MGLTFAAPAFLALLAALPLIVWWHVSRRRHRPRLVAGGFLWEEALRQTAKIRRRRPTPLLLWQLLAVAALAFALARPSLDLRGSPDVLIVVSAGASMRAVDPEGERLARAKAAASDVAERAGAVALLRAGLDADVLLPFTRDRGAFAEALDAFAAGDARVDVAASEALARRLAQGGRIVWIGDDPPAAPDIEPLIVAGDGRNVGIVAFDLALGQAFVALASNHARPVEVTVVLERLDGALLARSELLIPASGRVGASFPVDATGLRVRARLDPPPPGDALALDDVAFAGRDPLRVVIDRDEPHLRRALNAIPGVEVRITGLAATTPADVRVRHADPDPLPLGDHVLLPTAAGTRPERIVAWDRGHPLLRFVDLTDVAVLLPDTGAAPESAPWSVLARSGDGRAVLSYRDEGGVRALAFGMHPSDTDLVFRVAFPTLIANLIDAFQGVERPRLGERGDDGERHLEPGFVTVGGRLVATEPLPEDETRLRAAALAPPEPPPAAIARPTPIAWALLLAAVLALTIEWWGWVRGPGAPSPSPAPRPGPR